MVKFPWDLFHPWVSLYLKQKKKLFILPCYFYQMKSKFHRLCDTDTRDLCQSTHRHRRSHLLSHNNPCHPSLVIPNPCWCWDNEFVFCPKVLIGTHTTWHHGIWSTGVGFKSSTSHTRGSLDQQPLNCMTRWPSHPVLRHTNKQNRKTWHDTLVWRNVGESKREDRGPLSYQDPPVSLCGVLFLTIGTHDYSVISLHNPCLTKI